MIILKLYKFLFLISAISLFVANSYAQTNISGIVNQYGSCIAFTGINSVIVNDASAFNKNDTVLIIQMTGAQIDHFNGNNYGNIANLNNTGSYELNIIDSINFSNNTLFFKCTFLNSYTGITQVVKIPNYSNANVVAALTAKPWDGSSGGVLALNVSGVLTLNADINVTGKGFRGAAASFTPNHLCPTTSTGFLSYSYTSGAIDSAGYKGEGIAGLDSLFSRGRGKNATGGGGGHTYNAAGGGGSCYGFGGKGGTELDSCTGGVISDLGGDGGADLNSQVSGQVKLFLGGGGGAGLFETSGAMNDATDGGNGGGIAIIFAGAVIGNNKNVIANGQDVTGITANESAGGGGGGGCIVIMSPTITALTSIQARGGNGGSTTFTCRGSGGGGGGGLIAVPNNVTGTSFNISGGLHGNVFNAVTCSPWMGTQGNNGTTINNFTLTYPSCFLAAPITNNIIFNNQDVCAGVIPDSLAGTVPQGGNNIYSYQWEQSSDGVIWYAIPGATNISFVFSAPLSQTTHFRRVVTSMDETDVSNEVIITVVIINLTTTSEPVTCFGMCNGTANAITSSTTGIVYTWSNGITSPTATGLCQGLYSVTASDTISGCYEIASVTIYEPPVLVCSISSFIRPSCNNTPDGKANADATGGTPPYTFNWPDGQGTSTANNLFPGFYTVSVTDSLGCLTTDTVTLSALTSITNNIIDSYKIICGTDTSFPIIGNIPGGVDTTVFYSWWATPDTLTGTWSLEGLNSQNLIPANPGSTPMYYTRRVFFNGCNDTSNVCTVSVYPGSTGLGNNVISPDSQVVNFSQIPNTIQGNIITGGIPGDTLHYLWIKSQNTSFEPMWAATDGTYEDTNLVFNEGADTSFYYNRLAYYIITPEMKLACISYSNIVRILLADSNNIFCADTMLCNGTPSSIITGNTGNSYTYQWQIYNGSAWIDIPGETTPGFQPGMLTTTTSYRRIVIINGSTTLTSNIITIHIIPQILNNHIYTGPPNITSDYSVTVCPGSVVGMGHIPGQPTGGNGSFSYQWMFSADNLSWSPAAFGTFDVYQTPAIWDTIYFKRVVISGPCFSESNVISVFPVSDLPPNNIFLSADSLYSVCFGSDAATITETANTQGFGLMYAWEMKTVSGNWQPVTGASNFFYQPLNITETTSFHRLITNNQATPPCVSYSNDVTVFINPLPAYSLSVSTALDTIPLGSTSEISVTFYGSPPFDFTLTGGSQNYSAVVTGFIDLITVTPDQNQTDYYISALIDGKGCSFNDSGQSVQIYTYLPDSVNPGHDTTFCGLSGQLNAVNSASGTNWWTGPSWISFFPDSSYSNAEVISTQYNTVSQLFWHVQDGLFTESKKIDVVFWQMISDPDAGTDITLLDQNSVQLNAAIPFPPLSTGYWTIFSGSGNFLNSTVSNTTVSSLQNGENILIWTVSNGPCGPLSDTLKIFVTGLKIPEGFSPNGDGTNDYYEVTGIETFDKSEFIVFNRWGNIIYRKLNYDNSWNGKGLNGKPLPEDTYFYLLILNEKETKKGFLVLKR